MRRLPTYRLLIVHRAAPALIAGAGAVFGAVRLDAPLPLVVLVATGFAIFRALVHGRDARFSVERAVPAPTGPVNAAPPFRVRLADLTLPGVSAVLTLAIATFGGQGADTLSALLAGMLMGEAFALLVVVTWVTAFEKAEGVVLVCRDPAPGEPSEVRGRELTPLWRVMESDI